MGSFVPAHPVAVTIGFHVVRESYVCSLAWHGTDAEASIFREPSAFARIMTSVRQLSALRVLWGWVPPSARSYDCAGRRDITRRHAVGALQARLPLASARIVPSVPPALSGRARRRPYRRPAGVLWRDRGSASPRSLPRISGRSRGRTGSSTPSHPSPGLSRCSPISPATLIVSRSRTAGSLLSTRAVWPSATRITAATGRRGTAP